MTHKHHLPSKFEEFVTVFAGALGFTILFLFALSAFVNNLHQTGPGAAHTPVIAATSPDQPGLTGAGNNSQDTHDTVASKPSDKPTGKPAGKPPVTAVAIGQMLANGNAKKGAKVAKKCFACHSFDKGGKNKVGPNLYAIIGKNIGAAKDFKYSPAMIKYAGKSGSWNYDNLVAFLKKPKSVVKKTKMAFAGLKKEKDLANIVAYMRKNASTPVPLPTH